jgi:hypothetical protein
VDATANAGAQFANVLVTVREIWVNESATAAPDDPTWLKHALPAPRTLELVGADSAAVSELASGLKVQAGTYRQMRLLLVDRAEPLTESAAAAGALFNDQVTVVDAAGVESTLPLEIPNAAQGVGIETELVVPIPRDKVLAEIAAASGSGGRASLAPGVAVPGATIPSTTVPGSTVPGTLPTVPGATVPGTVPTVPGGTVPGTVPTVPGTSPTLPGMTVPGTTVPGRTIPGATVPGAGVPGPTVPGTIPGARVPGATVPGTTVPETTIPGATIPATTVPGVAAPGGTVPGVTVPGLPVPGITTPGAVTPSPTPTPPASGAAGEHTATLTSTVFFDATRDLAAFRFGDGLGYLLSPALVVADVDDVGTIQSQLDVSAIAPNAGTNRPDVEVTAERLDAASNRRVEVASAAVRPDGTFTLYPLPLDRDADTTTYDLVVHGPAVTTMVIRGVPVSEGGPRTASSVQLGAIALLPSSTYLANVEGAAPRGGRVQFYQTLADDPAPVLIEQRPLDPVSGRFAVDEPLSAAPVVVYGTFGAGFMLVAAAPAEGEGRYSVAASAQLYGDSALTPATLAPPAVPGSTAGFAVPALQPTVAGSINANLTIAAPGKYDAGALLVTHNGAVVAAAPLAGMLRQPAAAVSIGGVPAGSAAAEFARGLYFLEAWAWSSANPAATFTRQPVTTAPADLRAASQATAEITVD